MENNEQTKQIEQTRKPMTVEQTKIGVTIVLKKDDCLKLGFSGDTLSKDVVKSVRDRLGL